MEDDCIFPEIGENMGSIDVFLRVYETTRDFLNAVHSKYFHSGAINNRKYSAFRPEYYWNRVIAGVYRICEYMENLITKHEVNNVIA